jgi:glucose/arabinose dehydrogenase
VIRRALGLICLGLAFAAAGCDKDSSDTPAPGDGGGGGGAEQITGNERIGWQQAAATPAELAAFRYNIYIDNVATEMQGVSCTAASAGFSCSGQLPAMRPGRHTLEISAFVDSAPRVESARSTALTVNVGQASMTSGVAPPAAIVTSDGIRLAVVPLATGLEDPSDLAVAADGRIFISERPGRIRVFRDGALRPAAPPIDDVVAGDGRGVLALALDPDFVKSGYIFAAYTGTSGFRLARYRFVGDSLGEPATLLDGIAAAASPAATLRFGPDRKLYLGLDDAGDPSRPGDLGSFNGKVLRLNADGTTPADQAGGTPVYALNVNQPRGMDWDGTTLWIAESVRLQGVVDGPAAPRRAAAMVNYRLPAGVDPEGATFYRGSLIPGLAGDLLVASADAGSILRLRFDPGNRRRIVSSEYLLQGAVGPIQAIAEGPNGVVYFCTPNELFMIAPEPPTPSPRAPM